MQRDFRDQPLPDDVTEEIKAALFQGRKIDASQCIQQQIA